MRSAPGRQQNLLPPWVWLRLTLMSLHSLRERLGYWDEVQHCRGYTDRVASTATCLDHLKAVIHVHQLTKLESSTHSIESPLSWGSLVSWGKWGWGKEAPIQLPLLWALSHKPLLQQAAAQMRLDPRIWRRGAARCEGRSLSIGQ